MTDNRKSISQNIKRLLMFKALGDIRNIVDSENRQNKKDRKLSIILAVIFILAVGLLLFVITADKNRPAMIQPLNSIIEHSYSPTIEPLLNTTA